MYKLIYREYSEEIIVTSTDPEPLLLLIREFARSKGEDFDLVFYGKEEEKKPHKSTRGTGHLLPVKKENKNEQ